MKPFIALITLVFAAQTASADDLTSTCKFRYRDAINSLIASAESFNSGDADKVQFLTEYSKLEAILGATRIACMLEPASNFKCVRLYKNAFNRFNSKIDLEQVAQGEQTEISTFKIRAEMILLDLRCQ